MSILLIIAISLVFILYLQHYLKHNNTYKVLQADLPRLTQDNLSERYPIVVADRLVSPDALLGTLFKYTYLTKSTHAIPAHPTPTPSLCTSKYTLIYTTSHDITIDILIPSYRKELAFSPRQGHPLPSASKPISSTNAQYITIRLKKQQVMIMPTFWSFQCPDPHTIICLDDPMSLLVRAGSLYL